MIFSALIAFVASSGGMTVGTAAVDITPPVPLPLGGYTERLGALSQPGGDRLYARAEAFRTERIAIVVVSAEMLTVPASLASAVGKLLPPNVHLFLSATHTHCAPDSQMLNDRMTLSVPGIANFKRKWLDWYAEKIALAARRALDGPRTVVTSIDIFEAHPGANRGRRRFALPDDLLTEAVAREPSGQANLLWHYAAHPVIYDSDELHLRGDWPGIVAARDKTLVLAGAIGDVSPNADGKSADIRMANWFEKIDRAEKRRQGPVTVWQSGKVAWFEQPIALGAPTPHPTFAHTYHVSPALAILAVRQFASPSASVRAFRIGKLAIVGVPGEPTSHLGRLIRNAGWAIGFRSVLVVSHVNGWIGYILGPEDYDRGGYEATLSLNGRQEGERVVEAAIEALKALAKS